MLKGTTTNISGSSTTSIIITYYYWFQLNNSKYTQFFHTLLFLCSVTRVSSTEAEGGGEKKGEAGPWWYTCSKVPGLLSKARKFPVCNHIYESCLKWDTRGFRSRFLASLVLLMLLLPTTASTPIFSFNCSISYYVVKKSLDFFLNKGVCTQLHSVICYFRKPK